ncbi:MAG: hypothetical protein PF961_22320 [Planctomycetota bacterium]|jgi:hypothetical protein|nr:hypothetical protein [Planctomycetota bacterium]
MAATIDRDAQLAFLQDELRDTIAALNRLYHPVYPVAPERTKLLEARVAELRSAIAARRHELADA